MKRILFDQGVPVALRKSIDGDVVTAFKMGWSQLANGALLSAAENQGFDVFVTCDQSLRYQQNLARRSIAIVVLRTTAWPIIREHLAAIGEAVTQAQSGSFIELIDRSDASRRS